MVCVDACPPLPKAADLDVPALLVDRRSTMLAHAYEKKFAGAASPTHLHWWQFFTRSLSRQVRKQGCRCDFPLRLSS